MDVESLIKGWSSLIITMILLSAIPSILVFVFYGRQEQALHEDDRRKFNQIKRDRLQAVKITFAGMFVVQFFIYITFFYPK